jgi:hypothetical protein
VRVLGGAVDQIDWLSDSTVNSSWCRLEVFARFGSHNRLGPATEIA